jgi:redox-sensitive bicupin YhaK (pirin superfamily)
MSAATGEMPMPHRSVSKVATVPSHRHGPGLTTTDIGERELGEAIDPFIIVSLYDMAGPTFPPHPHAGFSVATYILPESPIGFVNQDSIGNRNRIAPGALHLTVAGRGVIHEEQPERTGSLARGYQIWMDHADADREIAPHALHLRADDVPIAKAGGATVRVVMGTSHGLRSPLSPPTDVTLADVALEAGASFTHSLDDGDNAFLLMLDGDARLGDRIVAASQMAATSRGDTLTVTAGATGARFTLFAGKPFRHAKAQGGPFVGSDAAQLARFGKAYQEGAFGRLAPFAAQPDWAPSEGWGT